MSSIENNKQNNCFLCSINLTEINHLCNKCNNQFCHQCSNDINISNCTNCNITIQFCSHCIYDDSINLYTCNICLVNNRTYGIDKIQTNDSYDEYENKLYSIKEKKFLHKLYKTNKQFLN